MPIDLYKLLQRKKSKSWFKHFKNVMSGKPNSKADLIRFIRNSEKQKLINPEMMSMIERLLQVSDMQVREVMVPKSKMIIIDKKHSLEAIMNIVIESAHSRFPVFDPDSQDIIGILLAKDLLKCVFKKKNFDILQFIRPAVFTSQSKRLDILLREFRVNHKHIAIVLDEYGLITGLITIEDVLEQIVGEIDDEYDIEDDYEYIRKLDEETYILKGTTPITEFKSHFKLGLDTQDAQNLGQLIQKQFSHSPSRGETIKINNWRFKILHSDKKRIYLMEMREEK